MKNRGIDFIGLFVANVCDRYLSVCVCVCVENEKSWKQYL